MMNNNVVCIFVALVVSHCDFYSLDIGSDCAVSSPLHYADRYKAPFYFTATCPILAALI